MGWLHLWTFWQLFFLRWGGSIISTNSNVDIIINRSAVMRSDYWDCKSAQQCTTRRHPNHSPKLHPGLCSSREGETDRHIHRWPWPIYFLPQLCLTWNVTMDNLTLGTTLHAANSHMPSNIIFLQPGMLGGHSIALQCSIAGTINSDWQQKCNVCYYDHVKRT